MVQICLQCGDIGFSNALVYCVNCLQYAVHRYCLNKLPVTFDEFVYWVCDDCDVELPQHFGSLLNTEAIQLKNGDYINSKHGKANSKGRSFKRKKSGNRVLDSAENLPQDQSPGDDFPRKMNTRKKIKKSAREFSSGTFMKKLANFRKEKACQPYTENKLNDHVDCEKLENKHCSPSKAENKMKHNEKIMESETNFSLEVPSIAHCLSEFPHESNSEGNLNECMKSPELEKKNASLSDPMMEHNRCQSGDVNAELDASVTYNQGVEFCPLNKSKKKKRVVGTLSADLQRRRRPEQPGFGPGHLSGDGTLCNYELAQPLADPIWRGSFNVLNREYEEFEGMVAHLSKKACQKAYEEARLFPTLLDLKMYPKLDVWPKSFERSEPSHDSIALYFFPMHKRYERMFDHLVEQMMNDELALKVILENAELLIFTSRELPLNYWRFQGKYYLWGVFRGKQPPSVSQLSCNNDVGVKKDAEPTEVKELECIESSSPLSNCTDA